jgi:hypothetical protein
MQFFEILCITLGILNGVTMALLPAWDDSRRPLGAIGAFSVVLALAIFFLPVIVSSPRFVPTLGITLVGAFVGWFATRNMKQTAVGTAKTEQSEMPLARAEA